MRLREWLQHRPRELTDAQERLAQMVRHKMEAVAGATIDDLERWQTMLRSVANQLEDLQLRTRLAVDREHANDP
jgi:hypothetical protein